MELCAQQIAKWYHRRSDGANRFFAVKEMSFSACSGTLTVLTGRSGSGKTTLLHMLGTLLRPDQGKVLLDSRDLYTMDDRELSGFRNSRYGIIPQGYTAVRSLTVLENVLLPVKMYSRGKDLPFGTEPAEQEAQRLLLRFGMADLSDEYPDRLSGGEQRRLAVARVLAGKPPVILADEPTGDLDDENTVFVMEELRKAADEGAIVVVVTHENDALSYADYSWRMNAGTLMAED